MSLRRWLSSSCKRAILAIFPTFLQKICCRYTSVINSELCSFSPCGAIFSGVCPKKVVSLQFDFATDYAAAYRHIASARRLHPQVLQEPLAAGCAVCRRHCRGAFPGGRAAGAFRLAVDPRPRPPLLGRAGGGDCGNGLVYSASAAQDAGPRPSPLPCRRRQDNRQALPRGQRQAAQPAAIAAGNDPTLRIQHSEFRIARRRRRAEDRPAAPRALPQCC